MNLHIVITLFAYKKMNLILDKQSPFLHKLNRMEYFQGNMSIDYR